MKVVPLNGGVLNKKTVEFFANDGICGVRLFVLDTLLRPVRGAEALYTAGE